MNRFKTRLTATVLAVVASLALAATAGAAPVVGPAGEAFYTPPGSLPASNGTLIQYRSNTLQLGAGSPGIKSWKVMYRSSRVDGTAVPVTGTVIVPTASWTGGGSRPIVTYAIGTHGVAKKCAASKQFETGKDYEIANIVAALQRGYAVVITDYDGYTLGSKHSYIVAGNEARAVLDIVRAADDIPNVGISASSKLAIWGYSQGGQAAAAAGEIETSYAPELNTIAVAAGGVPGNLRETATYLDGANGSAFLMLAVYGLSQQYPAALPLATLANAQGQAVLADGENICVFEGLFKYMNKSISQYTVGNKSMAQLLADPAIGAAVDAQKLGTKKITAPTLLYHGEADEFIPLPQAVKLKQDYCGKGTRVSYASFKSEHITTQFQGAGLALDFIRDRLANKFDLGTCITLRPKPTSTANNPTGDLIFSLKDWALSGKVGLKLLGQDVVLPAGAKFRADANLTTNTLFGQNAVKIPEFCQTIWVTLLPLNVCLNISSVGNTTGTVSIDNDGILKIQGSTQVDIQVRSIGAGGPFQVPLGCHTATPSTLTLNYQGPISDLGNGNVGFSGTTTFSQLTDCGGVEGVLSLLMSGPGQTYTFSVAPPGSTWY